MSGNHSTRFLIDAYGMDKKVEQFVGNYLIRNHHQMDDPDIMVGGAVDPSDLQGPNGGFPPLYKLERNPTQKDTEKQVKREYVSRKTSVNIKNIMEKRRKDAPFIPLDAGAVENTASSDSSIVLSDISY